MIAKSSMIYVNEYSDPFLYRYYYIYYQILIFPLFFLNVFIDTIYIIIPNIKIKINNKKL